MSTDMPLALELREVTKRFGSVVANDAITLSVAPGEIVGILGENGAGKSTLMNILSGILRPDQGDISISGQDTAFTSPRHAMGAGVGMVHQHFMLVPALSVLENIALGDQSVRAFPMDLSALRARVEEISERLDLRLNPDARIGDLTVGEQQRVEIARVMTRDPAILILDEPTAVLTSEESTRLFDALRTLVGRGTTVLLISHKLEDIFAVCDRVAVLRHGAKVFEATLGETDREELVAAMVGEAVESPVRDEMHTLGDALLQVESVSLRRDNGTVAVNDLRFDVHAGEIVAIAGVEGNGQREVAEAIAGLRGVDRGLIRYRGQTIAANVGARHLRRRGLRHITENRHDTGVLLSHALSENHLLGHLRAAAFNKWGWLRRRRVAATTSRAINAFDVRAPGIGAPMSALSGGNQQKMVLGRELEEGLRFLIASHPTRGLDIRTIAAIQMHLLRLRREDVGILLISSDLNEVWRTADRILVLAGGRAFGPVETEQTTRQQVGAWMVGQG